MVEEIEKQELDCANKSEVTCGIVMPISAIDGCSESHWGDVKSILKEAIAMAGYEAELVSDAEDIGIIQTRIVQNLYDKDIIVCDVSCKNANVMFELGMRLAFDKPTIIVIDDKTGFPFDTSPIEHLVYPRDLRYSKILDFKNRLKDKICGTIKKAQEDPSYSPFLKNFGEFKIAKIEHKEGSASDVIMQQLSEIKQEMGRISRTNRIETEANDRLNHIINLKARSLINEYLRMTGIPENVIYDNKNNERLGLEAYFSNNAELRCMCNTRDRILRAIDDNILPF